MELDGFELFKVLGGFGFMAWCEWRLLPRLGRAAALLEAVARRVGVPEQQITGAAPPPPPPSSSAPTDPMPTFRVLRGEG